jgi:predicted ATPase
MVLYSTAVDDGNSNNFAMLTRAASNLLSISWGGQIIFSERTLRALELPSGSRIRDLGFHSLKEIDAPVHVFELLHPHLPAIDHPPLQSISLRSTNFPTLTPAFVGRELELNELTNLINSPDRRIISLVGPGGVGKTSLAVQFANQIAEHFPDGIFFISLGPIQDPDLIPIVLADTLKFSFYGPRNHTDQLSDYLHRFNALLVFDDFEHLRLEGANFLAFLLCKTHHLKILVTTRERLNLIAETILEVQGLPVPPPEMTENLASYSSIQLFLKNAQRISPRFSFENNASAILRICQLVDGLPLGIVLASSWVRVYSCQQIAEEIKNNIDFLTVTSPDIVSRHRSLRAVFDSSWQLLSDEERRILRQLSIFQAAFTAHAAQDVCSASSLILASLVDKSLLLHRQDDRYEMLETFNQYASAKLQTFTEEFLATRSKFSEYYANFCIQKNQELNSSIQRQALDEMSSEIENIRISWSWLVEYDRWDIIEKVKDPLLTFHIMIGYFIQGREFFRLALIRLNKLNDPALGLVHASMQQLDAWMTIRTGSITEGVQGLLNCLETFRTYNSPWNVAMTLMFLADAYCILGNSRQGKIFIDEALQTIAECKIPNSNYVVAINAHCQSILGTILIELEDFDHAEVNLKASLAAHHRIGTYYGTIHPLLGLARLLYLQGDFIQSTNLYQQALETATNIYDQRGMALIHNNLGAVYEDVVNITESYHHVLIALKLCKVTGDRRLTAVILNNLAYHQLRYLQHPSEAIRTYHESLEIFSNLGDLRGITYTLDSIPLILHALHGFTNLYANTDQPERALRLCYLIISHPQIGPDTQKRAIVSRAELETKLPSEIVQSARNWGESANLQDVINQILTEKHPSSR